MSTFVQSDLTSFLTSSPRRLELNQIIHGDALEELKKLPENSVDAVITDPPMMLASKLKIPRGGRWKYKGKDISYDFGIWDYFDAFHDYFMFTKTWVGECIRVLKSGGNFLSYFSKRYVSYLYDFLENNGMKGHDIIVHAVTNPVPQARKVKFMQGTCFIVWASKSGKRHTFNYRLGERLNWIQAPICQGNERTVHPTQKPLSAIIPLVQYLTKEGDVVLDPFVGSGTTAVACKKLDRSYIGIEIEPEYCKIAEARIKAVPERLDKWIE